MLDPLSMIEALVSVARSIPRRPRHFDRSTVLVRSAGMPAFYAIYCHVRRRFIELHYDAGDGRGVHVVPVPEDRQPPMLLVHPG